VADSSRRCPSADRSSSLPISNNPPYRPPRLPLDILYLISNFYSVSYPLTCRLVCPQPRRHNILHALTMAGNRCAGPLTTSSPTASSSCTKTLSSTHARSAVLCPPSWHTTSFAVSVGGAPHGEARLPQVSRMSLPLPAPTRYTRSTAACSPSLIQVPSLINYSSAVCSLRENNPSGHRLIRGLRLLTSRCTLTSTFWCLLTPRYHSRESASFLCMVYAEQPYNCLSLAVNSHSLFGAEP